MSYGHASHLWVAAPLESTTLRGWIDEALQQDHWTGYVSKAVTVSCYKAETGWTLVELVESRERKLVQGASADESDVPFLEALITRAVASGLDCIRVDVWSRRWQVETFGRTRLGARMDPRGEAYDLGEDEEEPDDEEIFEVCRTLSEEGTWSLDPAAPKVARGIIRQVVNLELEEMSHYLDWASTVGGDSDGEKASADGASILLEPIFPQLFLVWRWKRLPRATAADDMGLGWKLAGWGAWGLRLIAAFAAMIVWLCMEAVRWGYVILIAAIAPPVLYALIFATHPSIPEILGTIALMTCGTLTVSFISVERVPWRTRAAVMVGYELLAAVTCLLYYAGRD